MKVARLMKHREDCIKVGKVPLGSLVTFLDAMLEEQGIGLIGSIKVGVNTQLVSMDVKTGEVTNLNGYDRVRVMRSAAIVLDFVEGV